MSGHDWPGVAAGSLAGSGTVTLGYNYLALLLAGPVTTFSGVIQDGPMAGGSLILAGARLKLTGANTYTGGTTIIVGALIANNTTGSATGPGPVLAMDSTLAGQEPSPAPSPSAPAAAWRLPRARPAGGARHRQPHRARRRHLRLRRHLPLRSAKASRRPAHD